MQFSEIVTHIIFYIVLLLFIGFCGFIVKDIYHVYKNRKERQKRKNISFDLYRVFENQAEDFEFHAAYGVSQSIILFISEAPYFIKASKDINKIDYPLTKKYESEKDDYAKEIYLDIAIELSNIVANSGKLIVNHCSFYCENTSESFQIKCDANLIQQYCKYATMIHDINTNVKEKNIDSPEIVEVLNSMYQEFVTYFERINSLVTFIPIEKGEK